MNSVDANECMEALRMNGQIRLRIKYPWGDEEFKPFQGTEMVLGRDPDCEIEINDPEVSRRHAVLSSAPSDQIKITDLGSTNGTFVRGAMISKETVLGPGNSFRIGDTVVTVEVEANESYEIFKVSAKLCTTIDWATIFSGEPPDEATRDTKIISIASHLILERTGLKNLNMLLIHICDVVNAENGFIVLTDEGDWVSSSTRVVRGEKLYLPVELVNRVIEKGTIVTIPKPKNKSASSKTGSAVCVPIKDEDRIWGAIYLDRGDTRDEFQPAEIKIMLSYDATDCFSASPAAHRQPLVQGTKRTEMGAGTASPACLRHFGYPGEKSESEIPATSVQSHAPRRHSA
jgi:pSer/pThr/pTyr-binding forkhead associated (FHA) protein